MIANAMPSFDSYKAVKDLTQHGFSEPQARTVVKLQQQSWHDAIEDTLATKAELTTVSNKLSDEIRSASTDLRNEIQSVRIDLHNEIQSVRTDLRNEIQSVRTDLHNEIQSVRTDLHNEIQLLERDMRLHVTKVEQRLQASTTEVAIDVRVLKWMMGFLLTMNASIVYHLFFS